MPESALNDPLDLGARLQGLRKDRHLTLERLAKASGVSKSMLSQIERGKVNPTVATLWNLAQALGVEIAELLGGSESKGSGQAEALEHLTSHATPAITSADGLCHLRILNPRAGALSFEWYEMTVEPGGKLRSEPHAKGAREHLSVLEGELFVEVPGHEARLRAGETLRYAADQNHTISSAGERPARALLVVEFG